MFGAAIKTIDQAGGAQLNGGQGFVRIHHGGDPYEWVLLGDPVEPHGPAEHASPVMAQGSGFVRIDDIPVCREGHLATCAHATTGRPWIRLED